MPLLVIPQQQANDPTGSIVRRCFDSNDPVHLERKHKCFVDVDGWSNIVPIPCEEGLTSKLSDTNVIDGFFEPWVKKNTIIGEELSKTFTRVRMYNTLEYGLGYFSSTIYAYDGEGDTDWGWDESGKLMPNIRRVCTLSADLSGLRRFLKVQKGPEGQDFWTVCYSINIHFGGTALKAKMTWDEGVSISHFHP